MKISELLREYNEMRLINDFGNKLVLKTQSDQTAPKKLSASQIVQAIAKLDPTPNKEFSFWLALNYSKTKDGINRWEDISSRAIPALHEFKMLLRKPNLTPPLPTRDINQVKGLGELEKMLKPYQEEDQPITDAGEKQLVTSNQVKILINKPNVKVIQPLTKEAAIYFGGGTTWCTSAKNSENRFDIYNKKGPLYIILAGGNKYQWHFETEQYMDSSDEENDPIELAEKYPILINILSPNTTGSFWERLAKTPHLALRRLVAENTNTPPETLIAMSKDEDEYVRYRVAENTNTPPETLIALSKDKEVCVRYRVAKNTNTPPEALTALSKDENANVRYRVAKNTNTPPETLIVMSKDKSEEVRRQVAENINTPLEVLAALSKDNDMLVRWYVAENINTPPKILIALSKDEDVYVRRNVAGNINTPPKTLVALSKDSIGDVRKNAKNNKNYPTK